MTSAVDSIETQFAETLAKLEPLIGATPPLEPALLAQALQAAAVSALGLGRLADAESYWRRAIETDAAFIDAYLNLNILLKAQNRSADSEALLRRLVQTCPDFADAHNDFGVLLRDLGRPAEAAAAYRDAIQVDPNRAEFHHNLGTVLPLLGQWTEAADAYGQALALRPGLFESATNLGNVLKELGDFEQAEEAYRQALAVRPDFASAQFALALLLLSQQRFEEGWPLYETRYADTESIQHKTAAMLACPRWQGDPLDGKRLLIWQEGGLGDALQFCRFIPSLKEKGAAYIAFVGNPALHRLFSAIPGVDRVLTPQADLARAAEFDCWTSLLSAPFHLRTTPGTLPAPLACAPDLQVMAMWRARLSLLPAGRRVGLVWKGNPLHQNDANRSLRSLSILASLWSVPEISFVSLQTGHGQKEAFSRPDCQPLLHLGSDVADMADTAAIVAQLDLLICVDTAIAHLAGMVGTPCWIMLPSENVDWRWLHERPDSLWYPDTIRLFRQAKGESWSDVIEAVRQALDALA